MANLTKYYGYEDYTVHYLYSSLFVNGRYYSSYHYGEVNTVIVPENENSENFRENMIEHPELLDTAKKLYIHPACSFPRSSIGGKYKKCLNAITADAVITPSPYEGSTNLEDNSAVFINEERKKIFITSFYTYNSDYLNAYDRIKSASIGTKLPALCPTFIYPGEVPQEVKNATLLYVGSLRIFYKDSMHIFDWLSYMIPRDKIVFQNTLVRKLNDSNNAPTLELMKSIIDMLNSKDISTREVGLKTLATLNYADYKQSFLLVIKAAYSDLRYNQARTSTAVKYMLKSLGIKSLYRWISFYDRTINKEDYEIFIPLYKYIYKMNDSQFLQEAYNLPFVYIDQDYQVNPRLK